MFTIPNANEAKINKLLALSKNRIASCSFDEIKIFNFSQNKKPIQVIKENRKFLTESICYIRQKEILLFGGYKIALKLISMKTYQCITAIEGINCSGINSIFQFEDNKIIVGELCVIDVEKCSVESSVKTDEKKSHAMLCFENLQNGTHVLCGSEKGYFILYDTITKKAKKYLLGVVRQLLR